MDIKRLFGREYPRIASFTCLEIGLGEDFGNRKRPGSLIWFFLLPFGGRAGRGAAQEIEDFTCRSEKIQGRNCACSSPKAPRSCLHVAGSEQGCGLGCSVCPDLLPVSGGLPMLSDGCFSLSVVALHYYLIFHASSGCLWQQFWAFLRSAEFELEGLVAHSAIRLPVQAFVPRTCTE